MTRASVRLLHTEDHSVRTFPVVLRQSQRTKPYYRAKPMNKWYTFTEQRKRNAAAANPSNITDISVFLFPPHTSCILDFGISCVNQWGFYVGHRVTGNSTTPLPDTSSVSFHCVTCKSLFNTSALTDWEMTSLYLPSLTIIYYVKTFCQLCGLTNTAHSPVLRFCSQIPFGLLLGT